ncbi:TPA: hypothetical protein HA351_08780 [Methanosarcinaceae archaeon]|nr:hypothetical protein [Methanosarcinaceae archaeon]
MACLRKVVDSLTRIRDCGTNIAEIAINSGINSKLTTSPGKKVRVFKKPLNNREKNNFIRARQPNLVR